MNQEHQEIIVNQVIALSFLYQELARLTNLEPQEIMHLTCGNVAKFKSDNVNKINVLAFIQ